MLTHPTKGGLPTPSWLRARFPFAATLPPRLSTSASSAPLGDGKYWLALRCEALFGVHAAGGRYGALYAGLSRAKRAPRGAGSDIGIGLCPGVAGRSPNRSAGRIEWPEQFGERRRPHFGWHLPEDKGEEESGLRLSALLRVQPLSLPAGGASRAVRVALAPRGAEARSRWGRCECWGRNVPIESIFAFLILIYFFLFVFQNFLKVRGTAVAAAGQLCWHPQITADHG